VLAMSELPNLGIPTPRVLGQAQAGGEAALLCERIERTGWTAHVRLLAAGVLARIHNLEASRLSKPLRRLARISDPREYRTTGGQGPAQTTRTLVHGDYFSANILPTQAGLCVIDWETFGWGDPMWDLGFLIGADRDLPFDEVDAVIREYESVAPVDRERLMWHKRQWADYWQQRDRQSSDFN
jgi:Ser/Thr protein kinase RdoA (MazF antagonist)